MELKKDACVMRLVQREELLGDSERGILHGGVITTLLDSVAGAAGFSGMEPGHTLERSTCVSTTCGLPSLNLMCLEKRRFTAAPVTLHLQPVLPTKRMRTNPSQSALHRS